MEVFLILSVISISVGAMLIFSPGLLRALNEAGSRVVADLEEKVFESRIGVGLALLLAGLLFLFVAYYIWVKG